MKTIITILCINLFVLFFSDCSTAQNPTFTLTATNCQFTDSLGDGYDALTFDIMLLHTNPGVSGPFEFALGQYYFNINGASGVNPADYTYYIVPGSTTFTNVSAIPRNPTMVNPDATSPTGASLRVNSNTVLGAGSGPIVSSTFPGTRVVQFRLKKKVGNMPTPLGLMLEGTSGYGNNTSSSWRLSLPNPFTKVFAYVGTTNTEISAGGTYTVDPGGWGTPNFPPTPNFTSDSTTIHAGRVVNFTDISAYFPTSWSWQFPGGTPSTSNVRNPSNILYSSPGIYSVTLTAFNSYGNNTITKSNYITVLPTNLGCIATWQNTMKINDAGNITDSLIFGTSSSGTLGIDTCLGERIIPPPPPTGIFDCRFQLLPNYEDSKTDFRKDSTANIVWFVKFQPSSSGYPITFNWNPSYLPSTGFFFLRDALTGTIVNINMKNQSSYTLSNSGITSLRIEYIYKTNMNISLSAGWNITSVPLVAENMNVSSLFPNAILPAYSYNNGYVSATSFTNGKGYWLKNDSYDNVTISGTKVTPSLINVNSSWNIIGPFEVNIPVNKIISNPSGNVLSQYFGYNNGYFAADTLKSGKGYWVKTSIAGTLMKDTNNLMDNPASPDSINNWARFEFKDDNNNAAILYLAGQNEIRQSYELPPVPPSGIYDVRFASDKFVESFGQNHIIKLNSASRPVRIKALNLNGNKFRLVDGLTGNLFNMELTEGNEIVLNENIDNLVLIEENLIPKRYELSQNYPNPFNPSTTIKYQIPNSGKVTLTLYNVLGREIKTILNSYQNAGQYEIKFDASGLPSGVYFYKLTSGSFSDLKKLILVK